MHFKDKSELDSLLSIDTGERVLVNQDEFLHALVTVLSSVSVFNYLVYAIPAFRGC